MPPASIAALWRDAPPALLPAVAHYVCGSILNVILAEFFPSSFPRLNV
jgi:hypothetical protein